MPSCGACQDSNVVISASFLIMNTLCVLLTVLLFPLGLVAQLLCLPTDELHQQMALPCHEHRVCVLLIVLPSTLQLAVLCVWTRRLTHASLAVSQHVLACASAEMVQMVRIDIWFC